MQLLDMPKYEAQLPKINQILSDRALNQAAVAERIGFNSRQHLHRKLKGELKFNDSELERLATFLGLEVVDISVLAS